VAVAGVLAASVAAAFVSVAESRTGLAPDPGPGPDAGGAAGSDGGRDDPLPSLPPASPAEVRAAVDEIGAVVERERGLAFVEPVAVELAGEGDFQQRLLDDFDDHADRLRDTAVLFEALGLIDPGTDLVESMRRLLGAGVVGFYDPETDELVVRGVALTPYVRTTIAHELTHALDDQHFDLHRPRYDDAPDEIAFGFRAVIEGNARRVEDAYRASLSDDERSTAAAEELALASGLDLAGVPLVLIDLISAPYRSGQRLVDALLGAGGQRALDAALADPPRTSEQVIDPDAYLAGEPRLEVPPPAVDGEIVDEGVTGQLLIELVLADELDDRAARRAATGWGGDWGVAWRDGERSCATLAVVGDDAGETAELREAFEAWAAARSARGLDVTVEAQPGPLGGSGARATPVTVRSCAP
jgi:hypothetical protein